MSEQLHERVLDWLAIADRQQLRDLIEDHQRVNVNGRYNAAIKACAKIGHLQPKGRTAPLVKMETRLQNAAHSALRRVGMHDTMDFCVLYAIAHNVVYLAAGDEWLSPAEKDALGVPILRAMGSQDLPVVKVAPAARQAPSPKMPVPAPATAPVVAEQSAFVLGDW